MSIDNLLGLLFSFMIGVAVFWFLGFPEMGDYFTKWFFLIASSLAAVAFLIYLSISSNGKGKNVNLKSPIDFSVRSIRAILVTVSYVAFVFLMVLTKPMNDRLFVDWLNIPISNWIRFLLAIPMMTFFPGYIVLSLFDDWNKLSGLEKSFFSCLLSLLLVPFLGFLVSITGYTIKDAIIPIFLPLTLMGFTVYIIHDSKSKSSKTSKNSEGISVASGQLTIFAVLLLQLVLILGRSLLGVYGGDERDHLGLSLAFEKGFPAVTQAPGRVFGPSSDYWFHIFLSSFFTISGFPVINAYMILHFLNALPILAFYLLTTTFFKQKFAAVSTFIYTFFSGFGWIYALYLKMNASPSDLATIRGILLSASSKTADIRLLINSSGSTFVGSVFVLPSFLALIYLLRRHKNPNLLYCVVAGSTVSLGYLLHRFEILLFLPFYSLYALFFVKGSQWKLTLSLILGLSLVALIDFLAPGVRYTQSIGGEIFKDPLFVASFALLITTIFTPHYLKKTRIPNLSNWKKVVRIIKKSFFLLIACLYISGIIIHLSEFEKMNLSDWQIWVGPIPWYFDPIRFGVVGLLALISIGEFLWSEEGIREKDFLFLAIFSIYFVSLPFLNPLLAFLRLGYWEDAAGTLVRHRTVFFNWIPASILGTYTIVETIPRSRLLKLLKSIPLLIIVLSGVTSTLLSYEMYAINSTPFYPPMEELKALEYLRLNSDSKVSILTVTDTSYYMVGGFAGIDNRRIFGGNWWNDILYVRNNPDILYHFLRVYNIRFLYITPRDVTWGIRPNLNIRSSYLFSHLIKYLPVEFENNEAKIYKICDFTPPNENSDMAIAAPDLLRDIDFSRNYFFVLEIASLSSLNYSIYLNRDRDIFKHRIILTADINEFGMLREYQNWISEGGKLIVVNTNGFGDFADMLSVVQGTSTKLASEISGGNGSLSIEHVGVTRIYSLNSEVEALANYSKNSESVGPFALRRRMGEGQIIYVNIFPYLEKIEKIEDQDLRAIMFTRLGWILEIVGVDLPHVDRVSISIFPQEWFAAGKNAHLAGNVNLQFDSFTIEPWGKVDKPFRAELMKFDKETILKEVHIEHIEVCGGSTSIINSEDCLLTNGFGKYSLLKLSGMINWTIHLPNGSKVALLARSNNSEQEFLFQNGTLEFIAITHKSNFLNILARNVCVSLQGRFSVKQLFNVFPFNLDALPPKRGDPVMLSGVITFQPEFVEGDIFIASDLYYSSIGP